MHEPRQVASLFLPLLWFVIGMGIDKLNTNAIKRNKSPTSDGVKNEKDVIITMKNRKDIME